MLFFLWNCLIFLRFCLFFYVFCDIFVVFLVVFVIIPICSFRILLSHTKFCAQKKHPQPSQAMGAY